MHIKATSIALGAALVVAAGLALARTADPASPPTPTSQPVAAANAPATPDEGTAQETALPPNHPAIDGMGGGSPHDHGAASAEPASLAWKVDAAWKLTQSPSTMRLATYVVPRAAGDVADGELSISRAGGDVDSNVAMWAEQFTSGAPPERKDATVHGLKVTEVALDGTYSGGMGAAATPHDGWAMLGAIVEASGRPYFFKLTGPRATVRAARAKFDALVTGVEPR